ncbi:putative short chain dehydrogenase [Aspergillus candidus]|uniref:Putative short chain dehydrogenase n=1 Tax=Aspergillus candidus TaxID=41067 RepID=A0A2I2FL80_ASPCN|nr:putative short chain dehydrogenase [Aspergillus candidus]PLB41381.1 putative short chain dehydrogenase [Aspergillus candidus]
MSVYVITGVSRGIGFEFLRQISEDPSSLVIGLVRDKPATEKKIVAELGGRPNIHILYGDLSNYASLKQAAADTAEIVGERGVDYLVANGALLPSLDAYKPIGALSNKPEEIDSVSAQLSQTNIAGNIHLFHLFLPLVLKGTVKKVITISTGLADLDLTNEYEMDVGALYAAFKAALNIIVAKFNAQYKKDGVLFLSISPGVVDVGHSANATPEEMKSMMGLMGKIVAYAPHFKGPITPEESVRHVRSTWEKASIEGGYGGAFVSHFGDKQWV